MTAAQVAYIALIAWFLYITVEVAKYIHAWPF